MGRIRNSEMSVIEINDSNSLYKYKKIETIIDPAEATKTGLKV